MSGFAARTQPAIGAHDPLTVRALAIDDTAILVADVIGLHCAMSERIRDRCALPSDNVVVAALHTHGGPVSMAGRLSEEADQSYLRRLEDACVAAIDRAVAAQRPAKLSVGSGADPGVARNRRHPNGPVDNATPLLRVRDQEGRMIAAMASYACHPVVLGADNRLWTADYPHAVRARLEEAYPGAIAIFLTGCCGDANTGHLASASLSLAANQSRTFAEAERMGERVAAALLAAPDRALGETIAASSRTISLDLARREREPPNQLAARWRAEREQADAARAALLTHWISWADKVATQDLRSISARATVLDWGGCPIVALPGEIFAETALRIRARLGSDRPAFVLGFAEDNPGYIPPAREFAFGGYEIDEAHRYYGAPATFASGAAEALAEAALSQLRSLGFRAAGDR